MAGGRAGVGTATRSWDDPGGLGWQLWRRTQSMGLLTGDLEGLTARVQMFPRDPASLATAVAARWGINRERFTRQSYPSMPLLALYLGLPARSMPGLPALSKSSVGPSLVTAFTPAQSLSRSTVPTGLETPAGGGLMRPDATPDTWNVRHRLSTQGVGTANGNGGAQFPASHLSRPSPYRGEGRSLSAAIGQRYQRRLTGQHSKMADRQRCGLVSRPPMDSIRVSRSHSRTAASNESGNFASPVRQVNSALVQRSVKVHQASPRTAGSDVLHGDMHHKGVAPTCQQAASPTDSMENSKGPGINHKTVVSYRPGGVSIPLSHKTAFTEMRLLPMAFVSKPPVTPDLSGRLAGFAPLRRQPTERGGTRMQSGDGVESGTVQSMGESTTAGGAQPVRIPPSVQASDSHETNSPDNPDVSNAAMAAKGRIQRTAKALIRPSSIPNTSTHLAGFAPLRPQNKQRGFARARSDGDVGPDPVPGVGASSVARKAGSRLILASRQTARGHEKNNHGGPGGSGSGGAVAATRLYKEGVGPGPVPGMGESSTVGRAGSHLILASRQTAGGREENSHGGPEGSGIGGVVASATPVTDVSTTAVTNTISLPDFALRVVQRHMMKTMGPIGKDQVRSGGFSQPPGDSVPGWGWSSPQDQAGIFAPVQAPVRHRPTGRRRNAFGFTPEPGVVLQTPQHQPPNLTFISGAHAPSVIQRAPVGYQAEQSFQARKLQSRQAAVSPAGTQTGGEVLRSWSSVSILPTVPDSTGGVIKQRGASIGSSASNVISADGLLMAFPLIEQRGNGLTVQGVDSWAANSGDVAHELPLASRPRRADHVAKPSRQYSSERFIQRSLQSPTGTTETAGTTATTGVDGEARESVLEETPADRSGEIDELVEKAWQKLMRKFTIERERRGHTRWL